VGLLLFSMKIASELVTFGSARNLPLGLLDPSSLRSHQVYILSYLAGDYTTIFAFVCSSIKQGFFCLLLIVDIPGIGSL